MKKTNRFAEYVKKPFPSLLVTAAIWLLLEIPACFGFRPSFLWPFYFLTGALAGITGTSVLGLIGGAIGRAVIFVFFEQIIWLLIFSKEPVKQRLTGSVKLIGRKLRNLIPFVKKLSSLFTKRLGLIFLELVSAAIAVFVSFILSGNGMIVNSFSSIALVMMIADELETHSGLIWNMTRKLFKKADPETAERVLSAHAFGYALGAVLQGKTAMFSAAILLLVGAATAAFMPLILATRRQIKTEKKPAEDKPAEE